MMMHCYRIRGGRQVIQALMIAFMSAAISSCNFQSREADLIFHNATIYTVDDQWSVYQAMAIKDGKVLALGAEREILNQYSAKQTIDCKKQFIYPGFIDAHCHFLAFGRMLGEVDLGETKSAAEIVAKLAPYQASNDTTWIIGRGWDQNDWDNTEFPDRAELDRMFPGRPVYLKRIDGHAALANGYALKLAGITAGTAVNGGSVEIKNGEPTGILIDNAMTLVERHIPPATQQNDEEALLRAQEKCFQKGLTTVDEAGLLKKDVELIKAMQQQGRLKMRFYVMLSDDTTNINHYLKAGIDTTPALTVRAFKFYADGALGSRGACLLDPYSDLLPEKYNGFLLDSVNHFITRAVQMKQAGFQMCTHAIGDSANRIILNIYGDIIGEEKDHRWRIEHAQVVSLQDLPKFARYNIIPSIQPTHATSDMPWAFQRLGKNRLKRAYTYKELKEQLGMCALGTDFPVEDIDPLGTFYAAVVRKDRSGLPEDGFQKENALTREDALRGMTIWSAIANFEEHHKGSLEPGKYADIVILDQDLIHCPETVILQSRVQSTWVGGTRVYPQ